MRESMRLIKTKWEEWNQVEHVIMRQIAGADLPLVGQHFQIQENQVQLRLANRQDIPGIVELEQLAYQGYMAWREKDFVREWLTNPYILYLVIEDAHLGIVGAMTGRINARGAHISHLIVDPTYQRCGLASKLMQVWMSAMGTLQVPQVTLEVRVNNEVAIHFYQQYGFTTEKRLKNYYDDQNHAQRDAYVMVCQVEAP